MKKVVASIWVIAGTISLGVGILGIFLPLLPSTVFFLLAAFCYARGSKRFYHWLVYRSWFGSTIRNYREGRGIPLQQKVVTILLLWVTIGFAILFVATTLWLKIGLGLVAVGVTTHLVMIKTWRPEPAGQSEASIARVVEPVEAELR